MSNTNQNLPKDCSTCRFHSKQEQEEPLYFEENGEKLRVVDVVVYVCMNKDSEHHGKGVKEPITCASYNPYISTPLSESLQNKVDAAMTRLSRR